MQEISYLTHSDIAAVGCPPQLEMKELVGSE